MTTCGRSGSCTGPAPTGRPSSIEAPRSGVSAETGSPGDGSTSGSCEPALGARPPGCRPGHAGQRGLPRDARMEVVELADLIHGELVVEHGVAIEPAVRVLAARLLQDPVECLLPSQDLGPVLAAVEWREHRLTDPGRKPHRLCHWIRVQDLPQPVD